MRRNCFIFELNDYFGQKIDKKTTDRRTHLILVLKSPENSDLPLILKRFRPSIVRFAVFDRLSDLDSNTCKYALFSYQTLVFPYYSYFLEQEVAGGLNYE